MRNFLIVLSQVGELGVFFAYSHFMIRYHLHDGVWFLVSIVDMLLIVFAYKYVVTKLIEKVPKTPISDS